MQRSSLVCVIASAAKQSPAADVIASAAKQSPAADVIASKAKQSSVWRGLLRRCAPRNDRLRAQRSNLLLPMSLRAKRSNLLFGGDCFVTSLLAMTGCERSEAIACCRCHCERSEAISCLEGIASSLRSSQ